MFYFHLLVGPQSKRVLSSTRLFPSHLSKDAIQLAPGAAVTETVGYRILAKWMLTSYANVIDNVMH